MRSIHETRETIKLAAASGQRPPDECAFTDDGDEGSPAIVGMWHVVFTAHSMNGVPLPNPVIDNSVVVWHADGTEIMNSSRPAQDCNFCLGVWKQTGKFTYFLNHLPWQGNDTSGGASGIGNPQGGHRFLNRLR